VRLEVPPGGPFRLAGRVQSARVTASPFTLEDIAANVTATPDALVAEIERAAYSGGRVTGTFRIGNLTSKPQPMTLAVEGRGISVERFFGDIGLKGTGLSSNAGVSLALRWAEAGLTRADGGGSLRLEAGPSASLVRGRFAVPTSGGGPIAIVGGRIVFEGVTLRMPSSTVDLTGGIRIGVWQPDFDFRLRSRDLTEIDRVFQNFLAAGGSKPAPLGLGGSGEIAGHLAGKWTKPEAAAQVSAEEAQFANVKFGSVRGTVEMREGAFFFRPLRIYEGDAALSLEGMVRYQVAPGQPRFDLHASARSYPLSRILEYLDLKYPVEGRVTGAFPVSGAPETLSGGGPVELVDATAWGQKFSRIRGRLDFTPGRFAFEDLQADLAGGGSISVRGAFAMHEKSFEAKLSGQSIPLSSVEALRSASPSVTGELTFQLSGAGPVDRPDVRATASVSHAAFFGHALPTGAEPRLEATVTRGVLDATANVADRWSVRAQGDLFGSPAKVSVTLDAPDLAALLLLTPLQLPSGRGGSLAANATFTLPSKEGEYPSGTITVTRARLDLPERPGVLATSGEVRISLADGRLTFDQFRATGEGTDLKAGGTVVVGKTPAALDLTVAGTVDAALLAIELPDVGLTGKLAVDLRAGGTLDDPTLSGRVRVENGRYRLASLSQFLDDIDATLTFEGSRANLEARSRFGGGDVYAGGNFHIEKLALKDFRVNVQARRVSLRYPQDLRLLVDADLVASGTGSKNDIRGEVTLLRGTYSKDFEVTLTDLLARSRPAGALASVEPWKEQTSLEIRIVSSAALEVRNNLARLTATVDLLARGTLAEPAMTGQIVLDEGGRITFRDVRYDVEAGTITFANARGFTPILDIRARAEVHGYDLVVSLVGTWPRIQTSFSSDPPLPDEQILGLLLTGSAPTRAGADTAGESIVSTGASLAAGVAAGALTRPTQKFFRLDVFEIDPVFSGGQLSDLRSKVGSQVTPNLLVTTSQSFDTSKAPIFEIEWRVSNTIIVRARRDENGVYLLDVRRRTRY
jgi:autotransporter translocation and assembly factor TamB